MKYLLVKIYIFSCLFLLNCSNIINNKTSITQQHQTKKKGILESDFPTVDCGNIFTAYGFRFNSIKNDSSFVAIIPCPERYGEGFFVKGGSYMLTLTQESIVDSLKGYYIDNPYEKNQDPTYLLISMEKLK